MLEAAYFVLGFAFGGATLFVSEELKVRKAWLEVGQYRDPDQTYQEYRKFSSYDN